MRKITLFIMTLMMAGSLFAYEPSKENVTVKGENKMIAELVLTLALEMFPIQLPMTEKAYNDLQTIEVANRQNAYEWYYRNKEENKWLDAAGLIRENLGYIEMFNLR